MLVVLVAGCASNQQLVPVEPFVAAKSILARSLEVQGRLAEAKYHWRLAASVSSNDGDAASEVLRLGKIIDKRKTAFLKKAEAARAKGETESARRYFLKVLALDGADNIALSRMVEFERIQALAKQNDKDESALFANMMRQPGTRPVATQTEFLNAAKANMDRRDYAAVLASSEEFLETRPRSQVALRYKYLASVALADESRKAGRLIEAVDFFDAAQHIRTIGIEVPAKRSENVQARLAVDLDNEGQRLLHSDLDRAIDLWIKALSYNPNLPQTRERLEKAKKMRERLHLIARPAD